MRVGVDQTRHHDAAAAVDPLGCVVARLDRAHLDNRAAAIATAPGFHTVKRSSMVTTWALVSRRSPRWATR